MNVDRALVGHIVDRLKNGQFTAKERPNAGAMSDHRTEVLKGWVEALDLTTSKLAQMAGVNVRTVRRWLSGDVPPSDCVLRYLRAVWLLRQMQQSERWEYLLTDVGTRQYAELIDQPVTLRRQKGVIRHD